MRFRLVVLAFVVLVIGALAAVAPVSAQVVKEGNGALDALSFVSEKLQAPEALEPLEDAQSSMDAEVRDGWAAFRLGASDKWKATVDRRTGQVELAEGDGIPWVPGRGNKLLRSEVPGLKAKQSPDLTTLDTIARGFLPRVARILGVSPNSLVLNQGRSGQPADHVYFVDYDVTSGGIPIDGARVVFRVNNGNLIQFGSEGLPSPTAPSPKAKMTRDQALLALSNYVGGIGAGDSFVDPGSLHLQTVHVADNRTGEGFAFGKGRGLAAVWQFTFRREGDGATWRGRVDAQSGEVLEFRDINDYAQVTGGAKVLGVANNLPMPFANVSSGGFTNSAGVYSFGGGTVTSTLAGQYVRITDNCGAISLAANASGDIAFGGTSGTDCTTPGIGGAGNTFSARTQFYHLNRAKEQARGWLPSNTWLNAQVTANVNINLTCNAFWNGSTVNFYRSGGGCGNTGEIEGVSLHEYGHGLDTNDGSGSSTDNGTGETYGDWTAALGTHSSCIGPGFRTAACGGYGDACTTCTGVRDIDSGKHASNTAHTVANFTQTRCPTSATGYVGPCNREGHCESYVSSEALWDFANRDLPNPGTGSAWTIADRLWYLSRSTATKAFACTTGTTFSSNGCNTGSYWKTMRAVDDDDGNLANGTPHGGALFAAFNRHGIACTTDSGASTTFAGCTAPAVPALSLSSGANLANVSWTSSGAGVVYDVYRNERGCNSGFAKVANDNTGTSLADSGVANGFTYFYQVVAHPTGNEACSSAPSTCQSVAVAGGTCTPPAAPTGLTATASGSSTVNLAWSAVSGATEYRIYRSTTSGGPYTQVGTSATTSFSNTGLTCNTGYFYVVRAFAGCESGNSAQASATTGVCTGCTTTTLYSNNFDTTTGLSGWSTGTFGGTSAANWRGVQTCTASSGANIFRYGGTTCTADYTNNDFNFAQPNGAAGIAVPAGATTTRLTFAHRRAFETGFDGGTLTVSVDGTNYEYVPASAIISGATYNGTVAADCPPAGTAGASVFTGTQSTFVTTTVNLDAACNVATGTSTGCAGRSVRIGFTSITDCGVTGDGWFLDNVTVTACTP
ncbi:MAG: fibronectin type III domain-containing protein [Thermoanaerobaculia bacterium]